jgi:hypothetical protein
MKVIQAFNTQRAHSHIDNVCSKTEYTCTTYVEKINAISFFQYLRLLVIAEVASNVVFALFVFVFHRCFWRTTANCAAWNADLIGSPLPDNNSPLDMSLSTTDGKIGNISEPPQITKTPKSTGQISTGPEETVPPFQGIESSDGKPDSNSKPIDEPPPAQTDKSSDGESNPIPKPTDEQPPAQEEPPMCKDLAIYYKKFVQGNSNAVLRAPMLAEDLATLKTDLSLLSSTQTPIIRCQGIATHLKVLLASFADGNYLSREDGNRSTFWPIVRNLQALVMLALIRSGNGQSVDTSICGNENFAGKGAHNSVYSFISTVDHLPKIFKPMLGTHFSNHSVLGMEVAANLAMVEVGKFFSCRGLPEVIVPAELFKSGPHIGISMPQISGSVLNQTSSTDAFWINPEFRYEEIILQIIDYIAGNPDRHIQNILLNNSGNGVFGIDNDLSFQLIAESTTTLVSDSKFKPLPMQFGLPPVIDDRIQAAIKAIDPDKLRRSLEDAGLCKSQIGAVLARLQIIQEYAFRVISEKDWANDELLRGNGCNIDNCYFLLHLEMVKMCNGNKSSTNWYQIRTHIQK